MTKDSYFEMCEALGSEPLESEVPVEYDDLAIEVQEALLIYSKLRDEWDGMNGVYLGKSHNGLMDILDIHGIEDKKTVFELILVIDKCRTKALEAKRPKNTKKP
jgi:hypothetical protein